MKFTRRHRSKMLTVRVTLPEAAAIKEAVKTSGHANLSSWFRGRVLQVLSFTAPAPTAKRHTPRNRKRAAA